MEKNLEFLLSKAKIDMSSEEKERYMNDWKQFQEDLELLDSFDLSEIEELRQPFESKETTLRSDESSHNIKEGLLENSSNKKDEYIFLKKKGEDK